MTERITVHTALPSRLTAEVDAVLAASKLGHVAHGTDRHVQAGEAAAGDRAAVALIGPIRSRAVAETVEATAPAGLALIAPMSTWAGVTRDDEPGCEDHPADHRGTVFRLVARDTEVAFRIADEVKRKRHRALVVAGDHGYGSQLDAQLHLARLPRSQEATNADLIVLCGFADGPEIERVRSLEPLPVIAFDGVQGADLGDERDVNLALPFAPSGELSNADALAGVHLARGAAVLVARTVHAGARDRSTFLERLRQVGHFDEHGDPKNPDVWLWRADPQWHLYPHRALSPRS